MLLLLVESDSHYYASDESMETSIEEPTVVLRYDDSLVVVAYVFRVYAGIQCGGSYAPFCWLNGGIQHTLWSLCECRGIAVVMPDRCSAGGMCNPTRSTMPILYIAVGGDSSRFLMNIVPNQPVVRSVLTYVQ